MRSDAVAVDDFLKGQSETMLTLVAHDPAWSARFLAEAERLRAVIGAQVDAIEHVGSTAVPAPPRQAEAVAWDKAAYAREKGPFVERVLDAVRRAGQLG